MGALRWVRTRTRPANSAETRKTINVRREMVPKCDFNPFQERLLNTESVCGLFYRKLFDNSRERNRFERIVT